MGVACRTQWSNYLHVLQWLLANVEKLTEVLEEWYDEEDQDILDDLTDVDTDEEDGDEEYLPPDQEDCSQMH